jgi:hypothetical protein
MEDEPVKLRLDTHDGTRLELTPENSTLFTHVGELSLYDHCFIATAEEGTTTIGVYLFRHSDVFPAIKEHFEQHGYPMVLNQREVAPCDINAFERAIELATDDITHVPEDWASE